MDVVAAAALAASAACVAWRVAAPCQWLRRCGVTVVPSNRNTRLVSRSSRSRGKSRRISPMRRGSTTSATASGKSPPKAPSSRDLTGLSSTRTTRPPAAMSRDMLVSVARTELESSAGSTHRPQRCREHRGALPQVAGSRQQVEQCRVDDEQQQVEDAVTERCEPARRIVEREGGRDDRPVETIAVPQQVARTSRRRRAARFDPLEVVLDEPMADVRRVNQADRHEQHERRDERTMVVHVGSARRVEIVR
jgi:hypothetical protein